MRRRNFIKSCVGSAFVLTTAGSSNGTTIKADEVGVALGKKASDAVGVTFRPPVVPLVTCNSYFSIWSFADRLTYDSTRHWTGTRQELHSMVTIDGKVWRIMGAEPETVQPMSQTQLTVTPMRTVYEFEGGGVRVKLVFFTPMLPKNLDLMSRRLSTG